MLKLFQLLKERLKKVEYNNFYPLFFTIVFILILIQYSFSTLDAIFYDLWIKFDLGPKSKDQIVLVYQNEESDEFLGEIYPYTYATHYRVVEKILKDKPLGLNYLVQLLEPESKAEKEYFDNFKSVLDKFKKEKGLVLFGTEMDAWGEQLPPQELRSLSYSLSSINVDSSIFAKDDISRRAILNFSGEDSLHLISANFLRHQRGLPPRDASAYWGNYYNKEADATFVLYRFFDNPNESKGKVISLPIHSVFSTPDDFFKDKLVIIGPKYLSNSSDFVLTPFKNESEKAPKLNVHANIIESLAQDKTIFQIPDFATDMLAILLSVVLSYIISHVRPTRGLMITVAIMLVIFIISFTLFSSFGLWLRLSHLILSVFVVYYIWVPFRAIGEYQTRFAIEEEAKLLKQVDNLKRNFISLMSHDLKTPVAKIAGIADILAVQYQNTPEQAKLIHNIVNSTKELNGFISSILDLTKVESQNLSLKLVAKDVNILIENVVELLRYEATENEIEVSLHLGPLYPINVDVELIRRVLSNLIENAIKYSGKGSKVEIATKDDDTWVYIEIKDNGIGIAQDDLEHIFKKFYRVQNDSKHRIKGSGLGLYLVKYFIELHQGEILVESKPGAGTKFVVKLRNK
ncbi:MAG: CHASE2 domain-containing protein [Bacteriovoracaceae bacterium]|nr:CHASE2 domain-containing protein [Bacteriovoracaceae bacterium]